MNPYDLLSQTDFWMPDTYGYRKGRQACLYLRVLLVLVILMCGVGIAALLAPFDCGGKAEGLLLMTLSSVFFLLSLYWAWNRATVRRVLQTGVSAAHDYSYGIYRQLFAGEPPKKAGKRPLRNRLLLRMGRQDLLLREPHRALCALELVQTEQLSQAQLQSFFLYRAAAMTLLGAAEQAAMALSRCRAIPSGRTDIPEAETLLQVDAPDAVLLAVVEAWDDQKMPSWPIVPLLIGLWALFCGWYYGLQGLLPTGWHYRSGLVSWGIALFWLGGTGLVLGLGGWAIRWFHRRRTLPGLVRGLGILCVLCLCCAGGLLTGGLALGQTLATDIEAEALEGGVLVMRHAAFLDPDEYYYSQAVGPLLRRTLEEQEYDRAVEQYGSLENAAPEAPEEDAQPEAIDPNIAQERAEDELHRSECLAIYQALCGQGEIGTPDADSVTFSYSAKGSLYAVLDSGSDGGTDWETQLVYDRRSENGRCDLFVYYMDRTGADGELETDILEFYAVDRETLAVIPGEKTGWSDPGTQAYRDATGE